MLAVIHSEIQLIQVDHRPGNVIHVRQHRRRQVAEITANSVCLSVCVVIRLVSFSTTRGQSLS